MGQRGEAEDGASRCQPIQAAVTKDHRLGGHKQQFSGLEVLDLNASRVDGPFQISVHFQVADC